MKKHFLVLAAFCGLFVFLVSILAGHGYPGGKYRPPGDNVPPNPGGGGWINPGSGNTGGPAGPGTPGGSRGPVTPGSVGGPATPGTGSGGPRGAQTGGMARRRKSSTGALSRWEVWWEFNKDEFLDLKNQRRGRGNRSGTAGFLVGRGRKDLARTVVRPSAEAVRKEILPALLEALKGDDLDIVESVLIALARSSPPEGSKAVHEAIRSRLAAPKTVTKQVACLSLGILGAPESAGDLRDLMFDNASGRKLAGGGKVPGLVRSSAALALGLAGGGEAAAKLRLVVERGNGKLDRDLVACAVTALGLFRDGDSKKEIVSFLCRSLEEGKTDPFVASMIPVALGRLGDPAAIDCVVRAFRRKGGDDRVRRSCAIALGGLASVEDEDEIDLLLDAAGGKGDVMAGRFALIALGRIAARDGDYAAHEKVQKKIARFLLSEAGRPGCAQDRSWASLAAAIQARRHEAFQPPLIALLRDAFTGSKDPSERSCAAVCLGLLRADGTARMLYEALETERNRVLKGYVCAGLGLLRWTRAAERIRGLAADKAFYGLRMQAACALGMMEDSASVPLLAEILSKSRNMVIVASAAKGLGLIGDVRAVPALKGILADPKVPSLARDYAAVALGLIGEKTGFPWNTPFARDANYTVRIESLDAALAIL